MDKELKSFLQQIMGYLKPLSDINMSIKTAATRLSKTNETMIEYADNAAALAGGLSIGDYYRTGDYVKIVH